MNNIEHFVTKSTSAKEFAKIYLNYVGKLLTEINPETIAAFIDELEASREHQNTVFIVGNGGSAATASHMANDIGMDVFKKGTDEKPLKALALTDNISLMTAIANDDGYENIFVNQLKIHFRPGDKLVAISASGNSPNVIKAAEWVKKQGGRVIGLVGFDGGLLRNICDIVIHVKTPKGEYGPVEDVHLVIDHLVALWLQYGLKERKKNF